jgi:hypothetical protein
MAGQKEMEENMENQANEAADDHTFIVGCGGR